jgi:hypothetical protein
MLKETVLRTGCLDAVTSVAGGGIGPDVLAERLLLAIYAYGTNTGIRAVASGAHGHSEDAPRADRTRRRVRAVGDADRVTLGLR